MIDIPATIIDFKEGFQQQYRIAPPKHYTVYCTVAQEQVWSHILYVLKYHSLVEQNPFLLLRPQQHE